MTPSRSPDGKVQWDIILDAITDGLLALSRDGTCAYANHVAAELFSTTPDAMIGRPISDVSEVAPDLVSAIRNALNTDVSTDFEVYGSVIKRWIAVRSYPAETAVTLFLQDITDRKLAEEALRVSEAKFAGIVSISADAIISIDTDQRIIHFNYGAEEIFGWTAAEMIGQTLDVLLPERFRPNHAAHIRMFEHSDVEARRMGERGQISGLRRTGEEFPAEASISKLIVNEQRIFTVVLRDATERKRQEETYRKLYEEAQRAVAVRDDVLSFVSHDLGNPLAAIRIASAVLLKTMDPLSPGGKHVTGIRDSVNQAQRLIRDLLDVQKVEAGKLVLHLEAIDMTRAIAECLQSMQPLIAEKHLRVGCEYAAELPNIIADPDRVQQVLANLVGNAVKFSPNAGRVMIHASADTDEVVVSVRDEGPGIPTEELPFVFDRYWQAKKTGKIGHGLGLSIVQAVIKAHEGRVWAESEAGKGSTFFFALPVSGPRVAEDSQA